MDGATLLRWFHYLSGITWIGLLYYFNFVQVPAMAQATAEKEPGPAAIGKYVAPLALLWFRWGAVVTWVTGAAYLAHAGRFVSAFTLSSGDVVIGLGAWLGTIMFFNVWVLIWPNQQKVLGLVPATDEEKAKGKKVALLASRTNTLLSIPMLLFMGASHNSAALGLAVKTSQIFFS
ncbi:MAG: urate hydroxylase PuuD [Pseudomonadota bacterium]|nr:urate hydroxylase PuuD [Pseudomonadota bacterium]